LGLKAVADFKIVPGHLPGDNEARKTAVMLPRSRRTQQLVTLLPHLGLEMFKLLFLNISDSEDLSRNMADQHISKNTCIAGLQYNKRQGKADPMP
jgi:hypothetical protein